MVSSYIVLFGADVVGLTPLQIGVWASASAIGGITIGWWRYTAAALAVGLWLLRRRDA